MRPPRRQPGVTSRLCQPPARPLVNRDPSGWVCCRRRPAAIRGTPTENAPRFALRYSARSP